MDGQVAREVLAKVVGSVFGALILLLSFVAFACFVIGTCGLFSF
jgi:hypothetical protein